MIRKFLFIPLFFVVTGCSSVTSEDLIYEMQSTIEEMEERITDLESENEALKRS